MKELSTEQKAKRYDEAIKKAETLYKSAEPMSGCNVIIETLFPELKEGEDERIIKAIKSAVLQLTDIYLQEKYGLKQSDCISWLEKQGEHANFRSKIQIGDKVTRNEDGMLVNLSQLNRVAKPADKVEPKFHKGDIIKPKDGGHEPWQIIQVDIFDKKYRFKDGYVVHFSQEDAYELVEQKPTDEEMKELLRTECEKGRADAIAEQKPLSEEDEDVLENVEEAIINYWHGQSQEDLLDWLKSLKDKILLYPISVEYNEEDIDNIADTFIPEPIWNALEESESEGSNAAAYDYSQMIAMFKAGVHWLKSLSPQSRWKPSDEQMMALKEAVDAEIVEVEDDSNSMYAYTHLEIYTDEDLSKICKAGDKAKVIIIKQK